MSQNIQQIFVANPASSMVSTDLLYLGRSPYGPTDDFAITFANFVASIGTATPTASTIPRWDANINMSANNFLANYATTATAAAITTLTVSSAYNQYFTGTTTQTVVLPVTSTLALGFPFRIVNNSTGVVTVQSSGANSIQAMAPGSSLLLTCIAITGTTAASWDAQYAIVADLSGAVLLSPSGDQTIVGAHNLFLTVGNFIAGNAIAPLTGIPIQAVGAISSSGISAVFTYDNVGDSANFHAYKSASATVGVYSAVGAAEPLGSFTAYGDDGTQFTPAARIRAFANGTVSSGVVPGQWEFLTANSSGALTLAATINAAQQLILANALLPASGGTGVTSVTIAPTASAFAGWDANSNLSANNFLSGYATTATAGSSTTLTIASAYYQYFTGSTTQTCVLPHTSTVLGTSYYIVNNSSGVVTVNASGGQTVVGMAPSSSALLTCISAGGTTAASWDAQYVVDADVSGAVLISPGGNQTIIGNYTLQVYNLTSTNLITAAAINATSINFGGSSLGNYVTAGTFTPALTFTTPGDIIVSYSVQAGNYTRIGNVVTVQIQLVGTPTYTTASGEVSITGLPVATTSAAGYELIVPFLPQGFAFPASATMLFLYGGTSATTMSMYGVTPAGGNPQVGVTQVISGQGFQIHANFSYLV